jgi:hypothetical protein
MEGESAFQSYLIGALETFGIATDEGERAVMTGVWSIYEPGMDLLSDAGLDEVEPEMRPDMSRPPSR